MRYLLAFLFPPAAVLLCGKPIQAVLNLFLTVLYLPGVIHALMVISSCDADQRQKKLIRAIKQSDLQRAQTAVAIQPLRWTPGPDSSKPRRQKV